MPHIRILRGADEYPDGNSVEVELLAQAGTQEAEIGAVQLLHVAKQHEARRPRLGLRDVPTLNHPLLSHFSLTSFPELVRGGGCRKVIALSQRFRMPVEMRVLQRSNTSSASGKKASVPVP